MKLTNVSNYPVSVNGVRIETDATEEVEIEDVERYKDDRRFLLEEDDNSETEEEVEEESDDGLENSKSDKKQENEGE